MRKTDSLVRKSVLAVLRANAPLTFALAVSILGAVTASLVPPWLLKRIIDVNLATRTADGLIALAAGYFAAIAFAGIFDFLKEAILTTLGQKMTLEMRAGMMEKTERLPSLFFSKYDSGSLASRFTNDIDAIGTMFTGGVVGMAVDLLKIIGIVVSVWTFSAALGGLTVALLPAIALVTRFFQRRMLGAQKKNRIQTARLSGHLSETIKNARMIKVFNRERFMGNRYRRLLDDNYRTIGTINFFDAVFPPVIQITRAAVIALIVVLSARDFNFFGITTGMIAASIELVSNLFAPVENLGMEFQSVQNAFSGIARVDSFQNEREDEAKNLALRADDVIRDRRSVELSFNALSFGYEEGAEVLADIDLRVRPLEKVTFTGRTGVGKTTLFRLIMGLLKPTKGSVTINGIDVFAIPNGEKKRIFGYVDQNFFLVRGSVADQISLGDPSVTRRDVERALDTVGLGDFLAGIENGLDTPVERDSLFSQGQKQLLSIARAIVSNPPILLLDEMTANLDSITEAKIVDALQKAGAARTILAISHRPSSMLASDTVVILEKGRVRAAGSPEALMERDEWYRRYVGLGQSDWTRPTDKAP